jgi:UDP-N-acetylmuramoylalanine--D-glutamate ligase
MNIRGYFKGKKITILGLGLLGRGIGDVIFLAKEGADLIVTDLKTKEDLADSLKKIKKELGDVLYKKIKFVLGEHKLEDFRKRDFILKAAGVPLDSPFVAEARKNNIPIKMDASWFAELAPEEVKIIGVTGTRGKSTVTHLIHEIMISIKTNGGLPSAKSVVCCNNVWLGGNVRGLATLPLLKKVKAGDFVVMELDSWQLQGFGGSKISPNISIFTNLMVDHQNYYSNNMDLYFADKANIFLNQKEGDSLVCGKEVLKLIRQKFKSHAGRAIVPDAGVIPKSWKIKLLGEHNRLNIAYAVTVARILDIPEKIIKKAVEDYAGVPGRLEFVQEVKGVKYYNDTTATTPDGVMAALKALGGFPEGNPLKASQGLPSKKPRIILLGGGRDKELDYKKYAPVVKKSVKALVLFKGTATDKIIKTLGLPAQAGKTKLPVFIFDNMPDAFVRAQSLAQKGDIVLLSPGAASFGIFKNEFDRGDQFVAQVKKLK